MMKIRDFGLEEAAKAVKDAVLTPEDKAIVHGFVISVMALYPQQRSLLSETELKQMMRIHAKRILQYDAEQCMRLLDQCRDLSGVHPEYKFAGNALARLLARPEIVNHDHRNWFPSQVKKFNRAALLEQRSTASSPEFAKESLSKLRGIL